MIDRYRISKVLRTASSVGMLASAMFLVTGVAGATVLNVSGGGTYNFSNLSVQVLGNPQTGCINFYNGNTPDPCDQIQNNQFSVNPPIDTNLFILNSTGGIKDIPAGTTAIPQFISTTGVPGVINWDMLSFVMPNPVACPPAGIPGVCTAGPFTFTQTAGGSNPQSTVSFTVNLCGYTGQASTGCTPYTGIFSAQFTGPGSDISSLINRSLQPGGITDSVSATLNPNLVPEPATTLLLGSGLLAIGMAFRRFRA